MTTPAFRRKSATDHAVIRYMERKYGANFDSVRDEMLSPALRTAMAAGAKSFVEDGVKFIIVNKRIVTVVPA